MTTVAVAPGRRVAERRFYTLMTLGILATVLVGFARTYYLHWYFPEFAALRAKETYFYTLHGVLFSAWFLLLALQPALVATRRLEVHRKVGWFGAALAATMIPVGVQGALIAARRPGGFTRIDAPPSVFLVVPLFDMLLFALFVGLAIWQRKNPQAHKRLMLLASISILTAAVARLPLVLDGGPIAFFGITDLFLLPLLTWDLVTRRRIHWATAMGALVLIASQAGRLALAGTEAWGRFASWLIG